VEHTEKNLKTSSDLCQKSQRIIVRVLFFTTWSCFSISF